MADVVIKVDNLGKAYRIGLKQSKEETLIGTLKNAITAPFKNFRKITNLRKVSSEDTAADIFWANRNLSFEVRQGEVLGIIGKNGAGKSTLLKLLSQITQPTEGSIEISGRVASLLEVGTGFNPELTGKENIYLNGTILGLTRKEIDERLEDIVAFSGIEKFIETPVKRYSSGMKVRLAFAVAAHLDPEILIIDEVLAVGDAEFQKKCLGKMQEVAGKEGRTVLFVSHDLSAVKKLCTRAILLEYGRIIQEGSPEDVISYYLANAAHVKEKAAGSLAEMKRTKGDGRFAVTGYTFYNEENQPIQIPESGKYVELRFDYATTEQGPDPVVVLYFKNNMEQTVFHCLTKIAYGDVVRLKDKGTISCIIPHLPLGAGEYTIDVIFKYGFDITDEVPSAITFEVEETDFYGTGKTHPSMKNRVIVYHQWRVN